MTFSTMNDSEDSEDEEMKQKRQEENRRKLATVHQLKINQLLEVPPGINLFSSFDPARGFKYFTFEDLSLEEDFKYAR